jgi:hypothetical protein
MEFYFADIEMLMSGWNTLYIARGSPVRGKFLAFAVKLCGDFTGRRVSARSQRAVQGREFERDINPLRWDLVGKD